MTRLVTVDIGGTHARFALAEVAEGRVVSLGEPVTMKTAEHASFQTAWEAFDDMIDEPIPMNDGCLAPVTIFVPEGTMLSPRYPAAVVAGNVETSQVITDALFGAFGAMAGSQGTMNNFTFGNAAHQYYETIAGGAGAGPDEGAPSIGAAGTVEVGAREPPL